MALGLSDFLRHIRHLVGRQTVGERTDRELLEHFAAQHDGDAFTALMHRYGGLVWGVCRRLLRQGEDAEDAFQATFLVLVRQAGSIAWAEAVGGWLYRVAFRVAMKAKRAAAKPASAERQVHMRQTSGPDSELAWAPQNCKAFDPSTPRLITGSDDKTIKVWDVRAQKVLATLTGPTGAVTAVAFAWEVGVTKQVVQPNLKSLRVVSGSADHTARLRDAVAGKELHTFMGHKGPVTAVAVSPDLLTAGCLLLAEGVLSTRAVRELENWKPGQRGLVWETHDVPVFALKTTKKVPAPFLLCSPATIQRGGWKGTAARDYESSKS